MSDHKVIRDIETIFGGDRDADALILPKPCHGNDEPLWSELRGQLCEPVDFSWERERIDSQPKVKELTCLSLHGSGRNDA